MVDLAIAFALITTPPGVPENVPPADRWEQLSPALQKTAMSMELLDKGEFKYILHDAKDFQQDINIIRQRYVELKDAPAAAECYQFPHRVEMYDRLQFNRAYVEYIRKLRTIYSDRADEYDEIICECNQIYRILDAARDSRCDYYHVSVRRKSLMDLKALIGEEDFNAGRLPFCVPEWRFRER